MQQKIRDANEAAKASKLASELRANTKVECENLLSEAYVKSARNLAEVEKKISKAEGEVASWIEEKKKFETEMKKIDVYKKLAENEDLILGSSDAEGNLIAVADAVVTSDDEPSPTSVAAELSMLGLASRQFEKNDDDKSKRHQKGFSPFSN